MTEPTLQQQIEDRADEIGDRHELSRARRQAVALCLHELADAGEWPPAERVAEPSIEVDDKAAHIAALDFLSRRGIFLNSADAAMLGAAIRAGRE